MRKIAISIISIGTILFLIGLFLAIPSKELTTYSFMEGCTVIEEYVGGDAYNYIIGASLVGGQIAGAKAQKAIFISVGLLIMCMGLLALSYSDFEEKKNEQLDGQTKESILTKVASETPKKTDNFDGWTCQKCSEKNSTTDTYCKNCGEYK